MLWNHLTTFSQNKFVSMLAVAGFFVCIETHKAYWNMTMDRKSCQSKDTNPNRTLVLLMGNIRSNEEAWESLYTNLLDPNMADLAIMVPISKETSTNSSLFIRSKYVWFCQEFGNDWGSGFDMIEGRGKFFKNSSNGRNNKPTWRDIAPYTGIAFGGTKEVPKGSGAIIMMLRWFTAQKIIEMGLLNVYDRFIITRNDFFYFCKHMLVSDLDINFVWVPEGSDWGGISDRFVVCSAKDVLDVLDVIPLLLKSPQLYANVVQNSETLLKLSWELHGIWDNVKRYPSVMFTTATATDYTRWQPGIALLDTNISKTGLLYKYPDEFYIAKNNCKKDQ